MILKDISVFYLLFFSLTLKIFIKRNLEKTVCFEVEHRNSLCKKATEIFLLFINHKDMAKSINLQILSLNPMYIFPIKILVALLPPCSEEAVSLAFPDLSVKTA